MTIHSESLALFLASISPAMLALIGGGLAVLFVLVIVLLLRGASLRREQAEEASFRAEENEARMAELLKIQAEMQGRIAAMTEVFGARQSELNQTISQRLDGMSQRVSSTITEQTKSTHENLQRLQERLAVIDAAQNNIQTLAKDVVGLQAILSNKQTRGAFGQSRMETIVADGLPMGAYAFQQTLSNGSRPDCTIRMPNGAPPLVIDAKFPLEAWNAIRDAGSPEAGKIAGQQFRRDMEVHIRDISEKYLIQGETQDTAFLFVPSESIFAEIHEHFEPVVQKAHRARIVIVSPSLLMLSIQVIQAVLKDQRMRAQAHLIQGEVAILMDDLSRLDERVRKLQGHFAMAQKDIDMVVTSADKLTRRGAKIEALEFEAGGDAKPARDSEAAAKSVESRTGLLKLRVVDEE
ncbi:DNA recombination protein RmuC [Rhizobium ruizarguesonis]|uniref:DNA recombination protein RmuC n=1 Tax=Rhizobium TaxID=379 RepID=UPI001031E19B|nr:MULTISPECIES: DNA recombination protein RmuC [Rhizobium]NKL61990.1 DNA recombination protein RmuC [Rhizobium leguminosarum bv. viciae]TAY77530.1 DNA recombination protein RmuC [Rhizobium ruizarguesonis]TAZ33009.1 DNA recombination protein RmuC [Rhizobium ruizarguesonis]TBA67137.1 DNA recombination protein RmuC [Rhizobium ruizarguesonis]TBB30495.1 DNA recombination protein RmuC [Rhizobium ruizarguesonis]